MSRDDDSVPPPPRRRFQSSPDHDRIEEHEVRLTVIEREFQWMRRTLGEQTALLRTLTEAYQRDQGKLQTFRGVSAIIIAAASGFTIAKQLGWL